MKKKMLIAVATILFAAAAMFNLNMSTGITAGDDPLNLLTPTAKADALIGGDEGGDEGCVMGTPQTYGNGVPGWYVMNARNKWFNTGCVKKCDHICNSEEKRDIPEIPDISF